MTTYVPDERSPSADRRHLDNQLQELSRQYEQLTARIVALDTDIGRELDGERRLVLKQRRQELSGERDQVGADQERVQARPLRHFDGRLLVRELEPEVSYINRLHILAEDRSGEDVRLEAVGPHAGALAQTDGRYLVLQPGEAVELHFPGFDPDVHTGRIRVVAGGYYDPLQ